MITSNIGRWGESRYDRRVEAPVFFCFLSRHLQKLYIRYHVYYYDYYYGYDNNNYYHCYYNYDYYQSLCITLHIDT